MDLLTQKRRDFLQAALPLIPTHGLTPLLLEKTAISLGYEPLYAYTLFTHKIADFALFAMDQWNEAMITAIDPIELNPLKIRERVAYCIKKRLELITPHKDAYRQFHYYFSSPCQISNTTKLTWQTADKIWHLCGDNSTDFNYYSKRTLLMAVYTSSFLYWLQDHSTGHEASWEFLQRRIENVMAIGKFKQYTLRLLIPDTLSSLPAFFR